MKSILTLVLAGILLSTPALVQARTTQKKNQKASITELSPVYFDAGSAEIKNLDTVVQNAQWLKSNTHKVIVLEGHCDERGDREFNMRLGDRRARAVMKALLDEGVKENQLILMSHGKDRPVVKASNASGWSENRRVSFVVR